jgi:hypothetical protein
MERERAHIRRLPVIEKYDFLNCLLKKAPYSQIWEKLTSDRDLYFKLYIKNKKFWIYYDGEHILTLKYQYNGYILQDRWNKKLVLEDILSIINDKKNEIDRSKIPWENNEFKYQYRYAALDKRIIFTEYLYYYRTRVDLILIDEISNKIIFVEIKRISNDDFKTNKLNTQIKLYNNFLSCEKDRILEEMNAMILLRKELGLYELPIEKEYSLERNPLLLIIDCDNLQIMENNISNYTNELLNDLCGLIYTNKMIKIDMTKFKSKIYYEFK